MLSQWNDFYKAKFAQTLSGYYKDIRVLAIPTFIGLITGFMVVGFIKAVDFSYEHFLKAIVGYEPPLPAGEGGATAYHFIMQRPYLLPLCVAIGGLVVGLITYYIPEARGEGTEMAIKSFHFRLPLGLKSAFSKLFTSAMTIGSGGVSGMEGPSALIGGSMGSFVGKLFKLDEDTSNIAKAVGIGAGIAGVFKAPLAGALLSGEIFYKRDFEVEALVPGFIASVISYVIVGLFYGFEPMFRTEIPRFHGFTLKMFFAYVILGFLAAAVARLLVSVFFSIHKFFKRLPIPLYLKPAVGGLIAGSLGLLNPLAIGSAYGWLQLIMNGTLKYITPAHIFLGIFMVILGLSFTLGSGGSGGIFGPCLVIGGLSGASFYYFATATGILARDVHTLCAMTIVGMIATLAAAANIPLSTLILVVEITGGYDLLVPALIAVAVAYVSSGEVSMFPAQVPTRMDSPAHLEEMKSALLRNTLVSDIMVRNVIWAKPSSTLKEIEQILSKYKISGVPIVENSKVLGMITSREIVKIPLKERERFKAQDFMRTEFLTLKPDMTVMDALNLFITKGVGRAPVVDDSGKLVGIVTRSTIANFLAQAAKLDDKKT